MAFTSVTCPAPELLCGNPGMLLSDTFCNSGRQGRRQQQRRCDQQIFFIFVFTDYSPRTASTPPVIRHRTAARTRRAATRRCRPIRTCPAGKNPGDGEVKQKRSTAVARLSHRPGNRPVRPSQPVFTNRYSGRVRVLRRFGIGERPQVDSALMVPWPCPRPRQHASAYMSSTSA